MKGENVATLCGYNDFRLMGKLLLAYNCNEQIGDDIYSYLTQQGVELDGYNIGRLKESVLSALDDEENEYSYILYKYALEVHSPLTIDDCDKIITRNENVILIPVLPDNLKGTDYVQKLIDLGIFCAVFEADAGMDNVAGVMLNLRSRKEAKEYYGLASLTGDNVQPADANVAKVSIKNMITYISTEDKNQDINKRVEYVRGKVTDEEFGRILMNLPENSKKELIATGKYDMYFPAEEINKLENGCSDVNSVRALNGIVASGITIEIAVGGVESAVGTTHNALAIAHSLARKGYTVAIVEQNTSGAFSSIYARYVSKDMSLKKNTPVFKYENIDFYPYCSYSQFASKYKKKYNFVVVDFGSEYYCSNFFSIPKKVIVGSATDWKVFSLIEQLRLAKNDEDLLSCDISYLISFATIEDIATLKKLSGNYVEMCELPFYSWKSDCIAINNIVNSIGAVNENKRKAKKGLFW